MAIGHLPVLLHVIGDMAVGVPFHMEADAGVPMRQNDIYPVTFPGAAVVLHLGSSFSNREATETDGVFDGVVGSLIGAVCFDLEFSDDISAYDLILRISTGRKCGSAITASKKAVHAECRRCLIPK